MSPVLVQRAVSEDPRWTRAVGDHLVRPQGEVRKAVRRPMRTGKDSLAAPPRRSDQNRKALARANGASRRARGWAGEKVARSRRPIGPPFNCKKEKSCGRSGSQVGATRYSCEWRGVEGARRAETICAQRPTGRSDKWFLAPSLLSEHPRMDFDVYTGDFLG